MRSLVRPCVFIFCLLISPLVLLADDDGNQNKDKTPETKTSLQEDGLRLARNSEFERAEKKFDQCIALDPSDPACYWLKTESRYFKARFLRDDDAPPFNDEGSYQEFLTLVNVALRFTEEKIAAGDDVNFRLYMKARLMGAKGAVQYGHGDINWLDAIRIAKEALALAERSQYKDARALIGLINFKVATSDKFLVRKFALMFGLPGDRIRGLDLILETAKEGTGIFADDLKFLAVIVYMPYGKKKKIERYREAEAVEIYKDLATRYPKNRALLKFKAARGLP